MNKVIIDLVRQFMILILPGKTSPAMPLGRELANDDGPGNF